MLRINESTLSVNSPTPHSPDCVGQNSVFMFSVGKLNGSLVNCSWIGSIWFEYKWQSPKLPINSYGTMFVALAKISSNKPYDAMLNGRPRPTSTER